ncbi:MAG: tetratricopeptide repeat protein, partial [Actinomycetes bacterium]
EIALLVGEEFAAQNDSDDQFDALSKWLATASAWAGQTGQNVLIVLDGLDKLADRRHLRWFPTTLPPGVRLVVSCLDGDVLEAALPRLEWRALVVEPFSATEQTQFICDYLGRFRKQLTADQTRLLQGHPLVGNPLFLLTVLEELRVFGVHEELDRRLATLLSLPPSKQPGEEPTVDDVFEHVLARIEADHGREVVQRVMEAIWASRAGLFTDELLEIAQVPPATWAGIENSLDESLYENGGRTTFGHDYLRKAVEDRYDITGERKRDVHRRLGKYFTTLHVDTRVAEELPWQWEQAGEKERLEACLTESKLFVALKERDEYDLLSYWLRLGGDIGDAYEAAWQRWGLKVGVESPARSLVQFLNTAGCYTAFALGMSRDVMWLMNEKLGRDHPDTLSALAGFATCLWNTGDLRLMAEAVDVRETLLHLTQMRLGANHPDTLMAMTDLAVSCLRRGYPQKAWPMAREVRRLSREQLGTDHPVTIRVMNALADCELDYPSGWERSFLPDDSDRLLEDESYGLRMREEILRLTQTRMGTHHPKTLMAMGNLADSHHALGHLEEAVGMKEKTLHLIRQLLGSHHPDTLKAMSSLARSLSAADRPKEAVGIREELLCRLRQRLGADHHDTQIELSELTSCYEKIGLTNLSDAAAQEFGQHSGSLHLDFITNLSDAAAQALGGHKGGLLYLNGLTSLSDAAAESLARHEGVLSLDGLTNLSDVSAQALAKHKEHGLRLNGLASLSDAAAQALAQHRTSRSGILEINSVTSLSEAAAESFAQHKGLLNLNGLTSLSEAAARSLAKHDEWLQLNGLTSLSDAAARSLANHKEWLFLNGLASLSDAAAQALAEHKGDLSLDGLTSLGDTLGHVALARTLAKQNSLHLNNLTSLSDAAAESLARHEGVLSLNGLTNLSDVAAQALGGHKGQLRLNGITSLSDAAARALAQAGCGPSSCLSSERLGWPCFKVISENDNRYTWKKPVSNRRVRPGHLELNGLTSLSNAAAEALAQHEDVSLSDVAQLAVGMFGIATKFAQGLQATRLANEEEESDNDRPRAKIKKLLREKTLEGVTLGIALLESTATTPA